MGKLQKCHVSLRNPIKPSPITHLPLPCKLGTCILARLPTSGVKSEMASQLAPLVLTDSVLITRELVPKGQAVVSRCHTIQPVETVETTT